MTSVSSISPILLLFSRVSDANLESTRHVIPAALEGEPPILREVDNDGSTVNAEADVFNRVSVGLYGRCYWN
jgi:hypothetical protein